MSFYVGMDIGAVSATTALLSDGEVAPSGDTFRSLGDGKGGQIYLSEYRRTRGKPVAAAREMLEQVIAAVGADEIAGICMTGGASRLVAGTLGASVINEFKALASGLEATGLEAKSVFEMGGEASKYLRLARNDDGTYGIVDYATNGDCAAGTGSFIDQQAGRLKFPVEQVGDICLSAERTAQVAGRCSVFAKSDMIHAQQKGYSPAEVLRGLCNAVARNFRTAVVRSHPVISPVAFVGGVAANAAVVKAMRETFDLDESQLIVPPGFAHMPAIGSAVIASRSGGAADLSSGMNELRAASDSTHGVFPTQEPLKMDEVVLLRDRVIDYERSYDDQPVEAYLGVDIGSVSTNVVAIDEEGKVIVEIYTRTQGRPIEVVSDALASIREDWGRNLRILGAGTTGSGRELIGQLIGADTINDEITAHKTGATFIGHKMLGGRIPDTIFEIGGQDSKFISLDDGVVVDFTMNEACAAGTGSFLEERAEELDISIKDEFASLALSSEAPVRLGERCTVFMERDVNSYLQRGAEKKDLVAGLAYSVVYNYINRVVRGRKIGDCIFFQGGTAYNDSVAAAFAAVCGKEIIVPPHNGVIGAIGAALLARDKMLAAPLGDAESGPAPERSGRYVSEVRDEIQARARSRFRGYDLSQVDYTLREFMCNGCSNTCQIQEFNVEGEKTYWGDKCSEKFRKVSHAARKPVIEDLMALRQKLLLDDSDLAAPNGDALTVGIPMTMFAMETLPFWRTVLRRCGFRVVLSDRTNRKIIQSGLDTVVAEPCFPIIVAHGHVADLYEKGVDYILMPNILSVESDMPNPPTHLCPWHQTLPFVCRQAPGLKDCAPKFLTPRVNFALGPRRLASDLVEMFEALGVDRKTVFAAVASAVETQQSFRRKVLVAGRKALADLDRSGAMGIVLVGRPYNIHDVGVNLSVAQKLRDYYGVNCIPQDFIDTTREDISDINDNMFWAMGQRILATAKVVAGRDNLHVIYITNFKCGPDSFVKHFVRTASAGKPFLTLQFDGHSNDAGIMTRCEAYLDSKGVLRPWRKERRTVAAV